MAEKYRPDLIIATPMPAATTPNPAANLSWPMSYAQNSFERGPLPTSNATSAVPQGLRYDPVRQMDMKKIDLPLPHVPIPDAKRKREFGAYSAAFQYPEPQNIVQPSNSLQSSRRSHVCDHCGASFTRQHNLKSHLLTHTSSKKEFACEECGSEFRRLHDLKRHQKLHTGEKPFVCETCGRRFARADALGRHAKSSGDGTCVNARKGSVDLRRDFAATPSTNSSAQISPVDVVNGGTANTALPAILQHTTYENIERSNNTSMHGAQYMAPTQRGSILPPLDTGFTYRGDSTVPGSMLPHSAVRDSSRSPEATYTTSLVSEDVHRDLMERHERLEQEHRDALTRLKALEKSSD